MDFYALGKSLVDTHLRFCGAVVATLGPTVIYSVCDLSLAETKIVEIIDFESKRVPRYLRYKQFGGKHYFLSESVQELLKGKQQGYIEAYEAFCFDKLLVTKDDTTFDVTYWPEFHN